MTAGERDSEVSNLIATDPVQRAEALVRISRRAEASIEEFDAMTACLGAVEKLVQRRAGEAFACLGRAGHDVEHRLIALARCGDARTRWGAVYSLSLLGAPPTETRAALLEFFGSADGDIRWAAVDILLRGPLWPEAVDDLCRLLSDGNSEQKKMAAYALRGLKRSEPPIEAALIAALADPHPHVRIASLSALVRLEVDSDSALTAAVALLGDSDAGVRRAAAAMVGEIGAATAAAIDALRRAAAGDDESLRRAATGALHKLAKGGD